MRDRVASIVEGHGEVAAVPVLLRRLAASSRARVDIARPIRCTRSKLLVAGELERHVAVAGELAGGRGAILILLDADDDAPCELGPHLLERARNARSDRPILVSLAHPEFETWFLAGARGLAGKRGLPVRLACPRAPESIRGAKEWLGRQMGESKNYSETIDQPAFAAQFDILQAKGNSPSFQRLVTRFGQLVRS